MSRNATGTDKVTRAAAYARKSTEDKKRPGKSVGDQLREARAEIALRGWQLDEAHVYEDDGISASRHSRKKSRPGYAALVAAITDRDIDVLVMAEQSRASRRLSVIGALAELCADNGVSMVIGGRDVDPTNPADLVMIGVQAGIDAGESERTRIRVLRGARQAAVDGRPAGRNAYGYVRQYDTGTGALLAVVVEPHEADVVREIVRRILSGDALNVIARDLNSRGEPSPYDAVAARTGRKAKGGGWIGTQVRRVALTPAYVGKRTHSPEGQATANLYDAMWPAVITAADYERVTAILRNPARRTNEGIRPGAVVHWLTGILKCGECGAGLRCQVNRGKYRHYLCPKCFKVSRAAKPLEDYVATFVLEIVKRPDLLAAIASAADTGTAAADAIARLDELTARRDNLRGLMVSGALPPEDGAAILVTLSTDIDAAALAVKSLAVPRSVADVVTADLADHWDDFTPARKREIADALLDVTVLSMQGQKSRTFRPESVRVLPKGLDVATWQVAQAS